MSEQNIEVDEINNVIGLRPREDFYTGKYIHRSVGLILFNSQNQILLQKRVPTKIWYPNLYTFSVAGTVANESYEECMKKEMREEIGLEIQVAKLFVFSFFDQLDKAFHAIFTGKSDEKIRFDEREATSVKWIDAEELKNDIEKNPNIYTPPTRKGLGIYFNDFYKAKI